MDEYIDLTDPNVNLEDYQIVPNGYDCRLIGTNEVVYKGFILAKSDGGNAYTLCDVNFHESATDGKYQPRLTFRRTNRELADRPVNSNQAFQRISFSTGSDGYRQFWIMIAFLQKFKETVDLDEFIDRYQVITNEEVIQHLKAKNVDEQKEELTNYVGASDVSDAEMAELLALRARKIDLEVFHKLLHNEENFRTTYREQYADEIKGAGDEAIWHHFLSNHKWIFGLSLDIRFLEDFVDEPSVGNPDTTNRDNPKADMLGWSDYTVLVELKTPDTDIFTATRSSNSRAGTWSFSNEFIEGFSQSLAQKNDWSENHRAKDVVVTDEDGIRTEIDQGIIRTIDPQAIYIVGNKDREIPRASADADIRLKRDTLERFIRNNRNVNIISYDELYRRAYHIVYGDPVPEDTESMDKSDDIEPINLDDLPF